MRTSDFDYNLPEELIAQTPIEPRDRSRLMVVNRNTGEIEHRHFFETTDYLQKGDVLLFNDSRVLPARLNGRKAGSGGKVEILLLRRTGDGNWEALVKPGRRVGAGTLVEINDSLDCDTRLLVEVIETREDGIKVVRLSDETLLPALGKVPLPPYIHMPLACPERYQTVYAREAGSVAAPTAGLHFTPEMLGKIADKGVHCLYITLHISLDTFRPVKEDDPRQHLIYREYGVVSPEVAGKLTQARAEGRRIICVGTTAVRLIEQAALKSADAFVEPFAGWVDLFILPGYHFRVADALITNFHLPRSSLLMLVTAFAGADPVKRAYQEAIAQRYRFYSFGDAMLII